MTASPSDDEIAEFFATITLEAAIPVLEVYAGGAVPRLKADETPVTEADLKAEEVILRRLGSGLPGVPVISEEAAATSGLTGVGDVFILVDPLDGTREFLARNDEFTVNIGMIRNGLPVCGAVYAPALGRLWFGGSLSYEVRLSAGDKLSTTSRRRRLRTRRAPPRLDVLTSRSHDSTCTNEFLARIPVATRRPMGSSLKYGILASAEADLVPRFGPTMEWDTAAGDAVLRAAGGMTYDTEGNPLFYGKASAAFRNPDFTAWGDPARSESYRNLRGQAH